MTPYCRCMIEAALPLPPALRVTVVASCRQQGRPLLGVLVAASEAALGAAYGRLCSQHHGEAERLPAVQA